MTSNKDVVPPPPAPPFSAWSPVFAGALDLSFTFLPGWVVALICAVGVLCALPFRSFRAVVPLALLAWGAGWLLSTIFRFSAAEVIGLFLVK
jgi:hypothetical protein